MISDVKDARGQAEVRFDKMQRALVIAKSRLEAELEATRKKTQRLRELRLAKEALAGETVIDDRKPTHSMGKVLGEKTRWTANTI